MISSRGLSSLGSPISSYLTNDPLLGEVLPIICFDGFCLERKFFIAVILTNEEPSFCEDRRLGGRLLRRDVFYFKKALHSGVPTIHAIPTMMCCVSILYGGLKGAVESKSKAHVRDS